MQKRTRPALAAWGIGALTATVIGLFLLAYADVTFATNDDQFNLRTFMGFEPNGAPTFHLLLHGMYAFPLRWLSEAFGGVAWYSVLQIALLWLAVATVVKAIVQCFQHAGRTLGVGAFFAVCFACLFAFWYCARITFTTTAALLGAACVAQILSVDCAHASDKRIIGSMTYALVLLVMGYGQRQASIAPVMCYSAVAFLYQAFRHFGCGKHRRRSLQPLVCVLLLVTVATGGLLLGREAEIDARGEREHLNWQKQHADMMDYLDLEKLPEETLRAIGWSDAEKELVMNWYTMDVNISREACARICADATPDIRTSAGAAVYDLRTLSPLVVRSMVILLIVGALGLVGLAVKRKGLWVCLALTATGLGCFAQVAYLALQGRLPYRAVMAAVLPAAAIVFCLLPHCLPVLSTERKTRALTAAACGVTVLLTAFYLIPAASTVKHVPPRWEYDAFEDLDAQALAHPDLLFIYNNDLVNDMRMFPDVAAGIPTNLMFWGGWQRGAPEYMARLAAFGIDGDRFTAADWLNPAVRHVTLASEVYEPLLAYLRESLGAPVAYEQTQLSAGHYAYRFYLP